MNYWLFKSEPSSWSWEDQVACGEKGEGWDGVRNYQASNNMKLMKLGEKGFFYNSVTEKKIVGVVEIIKEYYPDPTDKLGRFGMVKVKALYPVKNPITLKEIKLEDKLKNFPLIKQARLSVVPVSEAYWKILSKMTGI